METMYFFLGVLTVVAAIVAGAITWGLLKINKQQRSLDQMQRGLDDDKTYMSHELERIYNQMAECRSYTDSRIDKALGTTGAKQVIKG